ncbi:MAG: restriction endonuclease subunit S [Gammaproteobacteria bacterium]|nr:restriction endonuclease subunit S [Gammaproteobacteria bacterium]
MKLPSSWIQTTVGKLIVDLQPGFAQKPGDEDEGTTPQIRTHNVTPDGKISLDGIKHVTAGTKEMAKYLLNVGDVVFNNTNSEEWVGKTAVFDQQGEYVFSNHMTRLRVNNDVVHPEYLASYLHLLWSAGFSKTRAKRWVSQAGIESDVLISFKLALPTILEQQRIVDVLRQADAVAKAKQTIKDQIDQLVGTAYWEYFSEWYTKAGLVDVVRISEYVADSQYGVSEAMEGTGSHAVLRMNSITTSGWLDLTDLKYANLSKKDIKATALQDGDLLFNRTNSKELVGKCAIWRQTAGAFSYASYLVRFRLKEGMLPEFLWATLNSAYGKYRLLNSAKQAVSMANVSPTDLGRITVPLPPLPLQEKFAEFVRQIEKLREQMLSNLTAFSELQAVVTQQALLGDLTAQWREQNKARIEAAALKRDAFLDERGIKAAPSAGYSKPVPAQENSDRPARRWLINELSELQHAVWTMLQHEWRKLVIVDDPEAFNDFCTNPQSTWPIEHFNASPNRIRRTLEQLAALGLIAKVSVPRRNAATQQTEYLTAFRPLRDDENTRLRDAAMLKSVINGNEPSSGNLEE